jgi:hypothetical protein
MNLDLYVYMFSQQEYYHSAISGYGNEPSSASMLRERQERASSLSSVCRVYSVSNDKYFDVDSCRILH